MFLVADDRELSQTSPEKGTCRVCRPWANQTTRDITVIQTMLRHAKPDTTAGYARELRKSF